MDGSGCHQIKLNKMNVSTTILNIVSHWQVRHYLEDCPMPKARCHGCQATYSDFSHNFVKPRSVKYQVLFKGMAHTAPVSRTGSPALPTSRKLHREHSKGVDYLLLLQASGKCIVVICINSGLEGGNNRLDPSQSATEAICLNVHHSGLAVVIMQGHLAKRERSQSVISSIGSNKITPSL